MLPHFVHQVATVNAAYDCPFSAHRANLMFKPLVALKPDVFLLPAGSLAGPAFYEALMAAVRPLVSTSMSDDLRGMGTERLFAKMLRRARLPLVYQSAKYDLEPGSVGECDLILADNEHIVFLECKAKALTRAAMSGFDGSALLDFALGILKAHAQALQHERILRTHGRIDFNDGQNALVYGGQQVTRVALTLLDHGTLHDHSVFFLIYQSLLNARPQPGRDANTAELRAKADEVLAKIQAEAALMENTGKSEREQSFFATSASISSLAAYLDGVADLSHFVRRIRAPHGYASGNQLFELYFAQKAKMLD
jgi:hypothetical protein